MHQLRFAGQVALRQQPYRASLQASNQLEPASNTVHHHARPLTALFPVLDRRHADARRVRGEDAPEDELPAAGQAALLQHPRGEPCGLHAAVLAGAVRSSLSAIMRGKTWSGCAAGGCASFSLAVSPFFLFLLLLFLLLLPSPGPSSSRLNALATDAIPFLALAVGAEAASCRC